MTSRPVHRPHQHAVFNTVVRLPHHTTSRPVHRPRQHAVFNTVVRLPHHTTSRPVHRPRQHAVFNTVARLPHHTTSRPVHRPRQHAVFNTVARLPHHISVCEIYHDWTVVCPSWQVCKLIYWSSTLSMQFAMDSCYTGQKPGDIAFPSCSMSTLLIHTSLSARPRLSSHVTL